MTTQTEALEATPWWVIADMPPPALEPEPPALETVYETIIHWDEGGGKRSRRELARRIAALYTAPPQRQPLTDAEIVAGARVLNQRMAEQCGVDADDQWKIYADDFKADARAVLEAAHGVKEQP